MLFLTLCFHLFGATVWGGDVGAVIERAYRDCFHTTSIGERKIRLRLPFAEEDPSREAAGAGLTVVGGGKGVPAALWRAAERESASPDFARYVAALEAGMPKVVRFDLRERSWSATGPDAPPPADALPEALVTGGPIPAASVADYLACVSRIGLDCSGFVWHVLGSVARAGGASLDALFAPELGVAPSTVRLHVNGAFFDPRSGHTEEVPDEAQNLRPGDLILFRGAQGTIVHSAVIQSVDLAAGEIRYLQCTDLAPREERGVHASLISFDPAHPETSLADDAVSWHQQIAAPFAGAEAPRFADDGERYRASSPAGHGIVVRLRALAPALDRIRASAGGPVGSGIRRL